MSWWLMWDREGGGRVVEWELAVLRLVRPVHPDTVRTRDLCPRT
jgi:hypothetical protein